MPSADEPARTLGEANATEATASIAEATILTPRGSMRARLSLSGCRTFSLPAREPESAGSSPKCICGLCPEGSINGLADSRNGPGCRFQCAEAYILGPYFGLCKHVNDAIEPRRFQPVRPVLIRNPLEDPVMRAGGPKTERRRPHLPLRTNRARVPRGLRGLQEAWMDRFTPALARPPTSTSGSNTAHRGIRLMSLISGSSVGLSHLERSTTNT